MKIKFKKYPRKPKAAASLPTLKRYLERCKEVDKENAEKRKQIAKIAAEKKERLALKAKIQNMRQPSFK